MPKYAWEGVEMMARMWLARDKDDIDGCYVIAPGPMQNELEEEDRVSWETEDGDPVVLCPDEFSRLFPHLKMEPGHKPIQVDVQITPVEGEKEANNGDV